MTERDVCAVAELPPGTHRLVRVDRVEIGVYNVDGELVAVRNRCPHAGAPLCHAPLTATVVSDAPQTRRVAHEGRILRCPWHGWEFLLPEARSLVDPPYVLTTYDVRVRDGRVVLDTAVRSGARR